MEWGRGWGEDDVNIVFMYGNSKDKYEKILINPEYSRKAPRAMVIIQRTDKWDSMKLKSFFIAK